MPAEDAAAQLLLELAGQRRDRRLGEPDLAARQHERRGAALADEQDAPLAVDDHRRRDADHRQMYGLSSHDQKGGGALCGPSRGLIRPTARPSGSS
ncbi:MAG TPA: hypothetical protein VEW25_06810, partial [Allosphingosinicella sp.]|nr:hypothetical protein [Allosphingosinicella sp.]